VFYPHRTVRSGRQRGLLTAARLNAGLFVNGNHEVMEITKSQARRGVASPPRNTHVQACSVRLRPARKKVDFSNTGTEPRTPFPANRSSLPLLKSRSEREHRFAESSRFSPLREDSPSSVLRPDAAGGRGFYTCSRNSGSSGSLQSNVKGLKSESNFRINLSVRLAT
jgi:hypothetical protein